MTTKNLVVPDIGGSTDVEIIEVLIKVGDSINVDTSLITVESDKATMEIPATEAGVVKELKVKTGDKVSMGSVILILEAAADVKAAPAKSEAVKPATETAKKDIPQPSEKPTVTKTAEIKESADLSVDADDIHAGPAVRRIAREFGIPLKQVDATGPKNRILKEDVQAFVKHRLQNSNASSNNSLGIPAAPQIDFAKFGEIKTTPLTRIQKLSGKNLHRNWLLVPHVTQFGDADITNMEDFRQSQREKFEKQGIKLTPLIFIMKAVVASLKQFPQFNSSLDSTDENLVLKNYFHIGVAVDTEDGLVVPVIRDVDKKGLLELAKELSQVSEKARKKQLTGSDMQGGCFSISSLGGIGGTAFTPIVNVPEVAILGVSKAAQKPVFENGKFVPRLMLPLSLSYDHRVIDGAAGARFMTHLSNMLSDIRNLLV